MPQLLRSACADCFLPFGVAENKYNRRGRRVQIPNPEIPILHQSCIKSYNAKHPLKDKRRQKTRISYPIRRIPILYLFH